MKALALAALAVVTLPVQGKTVKYYHVDAVGSVRVVTDASGAVVERHDYLPFGEECTASPCAPIPPLGAGEPRKYTGKERDKETGLDYFGARYYGAKVGRFTTVDPVYTWQENLTDPQRWNRYAYGRNNPLRFTDPDGRAAREMTGAQVAQLQARAAAAGPSNDPVAGAVAAAGLVLTGAPLAIMGGEAAPALARALIAWFAVPGNQAKVQEVGEALAGGPPGPMGRVAFETKAAARAAVEGMQLPEAQAAAAMRAIQRATTSGTIELSRQESGTVMVAVSRAGRNGRQVMENTISPQGAKTVVQKAYDAAGQLVHHDPK